MYLSGNNGDTFVFEGTTFQFTATADITIEAESYGWGAVVFVPTGIQFSPFFKVGVQRWEAEATATSSGVTQVSVKAARTFFLGLALSGSLQIILV